MTQACWSLGITGEVRLSADHDSTASGLPCASIKFEACCSLDYLLVVQVLSHGCAMQRHTRKWIQAVKALLCMLPPTWCEKLLLLLLR